MFKLVELRTAFEGITVNPSVVAKKTINTAKVMEWIEIIVKRDSRVLTKDIFGYRRYVCFSIYGSLMCR